MKISVKYIKIGRKKPLKNQKLVYHALVVPVCKGVWYFTVDFKIRTDVSWCGSDGKYDEMIYFPINKIETKLAIVTIDASKEKFRPEYFGRISKTNYHGVILREGMIGKAWDKFNFRTGR